MKKKKGFTLVESLVSILLISALLVGILGAFFISMLSTTHARHRMIAMNLIDEYIQKEMASGYGIDPDFYITFADNTPVARVVDDITYNISPYPPLPAPTFMEGGAGGVQYKVIGFQVTWNESIYGKPGGTTACTERAVTYVSFH